MSSQICSRIALIALLINLAICSARIPPSPAPVPETPTLPKEDSTQPDPDTYDDSKYLGWGFHYGGPYTYPRTPVFMPGPVMPPMQPVSGNEAYCRPMNCMNPSGCPGFTVHLNPAAMASYMPNYVHH